MACALPIPFICLRRRPFALYPLVGKQSLEQLHQDASGIEVHLDHRVFNQRYEYLPAQRGPDLEDIVCTGGDYPVNASEVFVLVLVWYVAPGANSGIKYNVDEGMSTSMPPPFAALGFEYQILDDDLHPDAQNGPNRTAAALYERTLMRAGCTRGGDDAA